MANSPAPVPLCDLTAQYEAIRPEVEAAVCRVLKSGQVIMGAEVAALESEFANYCGSPHAVGCGSGSDALLLALTGLGVGPGDEVILPPFTFFATVGSIIRCGATPVFADIDPVSYNIDPDAVERAITPRTKAIMPVHLYGQCAEMDPLRELARRHGLFIVEDAAQAVGAEYKGAKAGVLGDAACFSFYPSKNLGTYGDAGMVTAGADPYAAKMKALRNHGMEPKYYHKYVGWNGRIDALHAAILRVKLPKLETWTEMREEAADRYDRLLIDAGLADRLELPSRLPDRRHVFNQYVIRVSGDRDGLMGHLKASGVGCEIYYPLPLHMQECVSYLGLKAGDFPVSEAAAMEVLALPMFPEITEEQQARVVEVCGQFVGARKIRRAA